MASQPPSNLPLLYADLHALSSARHANFRIRPSDRAPFLAKVHAIPVTVDEFVAAQRFLPIVFSVGDDPVPLALMGLNENVNVFVDAEGKVSLPTYVPAYARRYPWLLARLQEGADELSLCFDPNSDLIGEFEDGQKLFDGDKPSEVLNNILKFCEEFEVAAQRTTSFMKELKELDILIDGEVAIQPNDNGKPFLYRGFRMVSEEKLRGLSGETLQRINENGILTLLNAHLFSLALIREIFGRQMQQGQMPLQDAAAAAPVPAQG